MIDIEMVTATNGNNAYGKCGCFYMQISAHKRYRIFYHERLLSIKTMRHK